MSQIAVHSRASRFPERRLQRREDALARNAVAALQSVEDRVKVLDERLGVGVGATKERLKLAARATQLAAEAAAEKQKKPKKEKQ